MHELSLATEIMRMAAGEIPEKWKLKGLAITVGGLSCVSPDSLVFCLRSLAGDDVEVEVSKTPAVLQCLECGNEFETTDMYEPCSCGSLKRQVISGREITVDSIEMKELE